MNFLLFFFPVLLNCARYKITHNDYKSIKKLILKPYEIGLYNEIIKNPYFLCSFEINEDMKEIRIIKLDNIDPKTGYNIFPIIFCEITNIKCLILGGLKLSRLPDQFRKFKELGFLALQYNKFREFPQVLFSLSKLRVLYLDANKFDTIPSEIIRMKSLEILNIQNCSNLINISSNLFKLKTLSKLRLSLNHLLFKKNDFITYPIYSDDRVFIENEGDDENNNDYKNFVSYKSLKKLIIRNNSLSTFPKIFCNFINLEQLDISTNLFEEIPYEIHSFTNLRKLNVSYNCIEKVIIENGMFNNLSKLYLEHNEITELF
ncbi:Leucine rich repeat protein, partial [Spraguea lophii 42_110]